MNSPLPFPAGRQVVNAVSGNVDQLRADSCGSGVLSLVTVPVAARTPVSIGPVASRATQEGVSYDLAVNLLGFP